MRDPSISVVPEQSDSANASYTDFETRLLDAPRTYTEITLAASLRAHHPDLTLTIVDNGDCDLLGFANSGNAQAKLDITRTNNYKVRTFQASLRVGQDEAPGTLVDDVLFAAYNYHWNGHDFIIYISKWKHNAWADKMYAYIFRSPEEGVSLLLQSPITDELILAACAFHHKVNQEILVFQDGSWGKSNSLWKSVQKASWDDVILDPEMKKNLIEDLTTFFDGKETYEALSVPWKRGILLYGEPGNGKTVTIKALMNWLSSRSIPTLYVKSFDSCSGPQSGIKLVFKRARQMAPCLLVFEDVDSLVTKKSRSFFLNEVDGVDTNDGILMVGSTNHLEKLDPALSKRPSRFDRKYHFALPDKAQRERYSSYWKQKVSSKKTIAFPDALCNAVANITDGFSFAYLQEAFVSALLHIAHEARNSEVKDSYQESDLETSLLWKVLQTQVKNLREDLSAAVEEENQHGGDIDVSVDESDESDSSA